MTEWDLPDSVETTSIERVGGGYAWESGVYDAVVKMVYMTKADSEAVAFNLVIQNSNGKELKEALYIKSGKAKGNKTYYTDKDGVDRPLPAYSTANSLCIAATGKSLAAMMNTAEKKVVNIYNYAERKEVPTNVPVVMGLIGAKCKVAVHQVTEDKNKKDPTTGQYEPTGETRTSNECKFFGNEAGQSAEEILADEPAAILTAWAEKNTGVVIDKTAKKSGTTSAADIMGGVSDATADGPTSTSSLFG